VRLRGARLPLFGAVWPARAGNDAGPRISDGAFFIIAGDERANASAHRAGVADRGAIVATPGDDAAASLADGARCTVVVAKEHDTD
jgi:hypothetical protein